MIERVFGATRFILNGTNVVSIFDDHNDKYDYDVAFTDALYAYSFNWANDPAEFNKRFLPTSAPHTCMAWHKADDGDAHILLAIRNPLFTEGMVEAGFPENHANWEPYSKISDPDWVAIKVFSPAGGPALVSFRDPINRQRVTKSFRGFREIILRHHDIVPKAVSKGFVGTDKTLAEDLNVMSKWVSQILLLDSFFSHQDYTWLEIARAVAAASSYRNAYNFLESDDAKKILAETPNSWLSNLL